MSTLFIFIDGLSYDLAKERLTFLRGGKVFPITPGIGFSNNLYPEMLCGQTPDEIGYFNEWSPAAVERSPLPLYLRMADILRNRLYLNAGFRKIFLQKIMGMNFANIPFKYAHYFEPEGSHNFRDMKGGLLQEYKFEIFDAVEMRAPVGFRDSMAIDRAESEMRNVNTLVSLVDLDNIAHIHGLQSARFADHIALLDEKINSLVGSFLRVAPDASVFVFSDHGMADVEKVVRLDVETVAGEMAYDRYLYFLDSTFLRVWSKDISITSAITEFLRTFEYGDIVPQQERLKYGIANPDFGDIIFRANEGVLFLPNFYGARHVKAMHGYDSQLASQTAFIAKIRGNDHAKTQPKCSKDVFGYLTENLAVQS